MKEELTRSLFIFDEYMKQELSYCNGAIDSLNYDKKEVKSGEELGRIQQDIDSNWVKWQALDEAYKRFRGLVLGTK